VKEIQGMVSAACGCVLKNDEDPDAGADENGDVLTLL
jgi:hypothetical protein